MGRPRRKTLADLASATANVRLVADALDAEKRRRAALAVSLLNDGYKPDDVLQAAHVPWHVLATWLSWEGELLVAEDVAEYVNGRAAEVTMRRSNAKGRSSAQSHSSTDEDRAYRHLTEQIAEKRREFEQRAGIKYEEGLDPELDDLIKIADNFFV